MKALRPGSTAQGLLAAVHRQLSHTLRWRHQGRHCKAPDWITTDALYSLAIALPGTTSNNAAHWALHATLRPGVPARALPTSLALGPGHAPLPLRCVSGGPARAQGAPSVERLREPAERGTATCLVRDRLAPDRHYVLTCGHVLAPGGGAHWRSPLSIATAQGAVAASVCEWQPALDAPGAGSAIDAGLAEVDPTAALWLRQEAGDWIPARIDDRIPQHRAVRMRRHDGDVAGIIKRQWSGAVQLPGGGADDEYFLSEAVGYLAEEDTRPGDSGAPVWTEDDALLGMHIGALDPESAGGANAVMGRVTPALAWFQVKPYTREDPATLIGETPGPLRQAPRADSLRQADDELVLARTLWGEARGEQEAGMQAVACVVINRRNRGYRGCRSAAQVCLDPQQFSCWNSNDPNRSQIERLGRGSSDPQFQLALRVAGQALAAGPTDPTRGALARALHYVARTLRRRPDWLQGRQPCAVVGNHEFYDNVA